MVSSACGIEAVYMCFNGTGIWGGETILYPLQETNLAYQIGDLCADCEQWFFGRVGKM